MSAFARFGHFGPGPAPHSYENVYCQRGPMENLIKLHKAQSGVRPHVVSQREPQNQLRSSL
jgi:hypothetical protein